MSEEPVFMLPKQVAERLGPAFTESWVRAAARETGFHSRGPNKKVIFSQEDFDDLVQYIKNPPRKISREEFETGEVDPFSENVKMPQLRESS